MPYVDEIKQALVSIPHAAYCGISLGNNSCTCSASQHGQKVSNAHVKLNAIRDLLLQCQEAMIWCDKGVPEDRKHYVLLEQALEGIKEVLK